MFFLFSERILLFLNGYLSNNKISQSNFRCVKLFIHKTIHPCSYQLYRRKYSWLVIVEFCIYQFWRHAIYCSSVFPKLLKRQHFRVFCRFFLVKLSRSRFLKLNISRTVSPILMILVSFSRILNGLSDEIKLLWRCSSPLNRDYYLVTLSCKLQCFFH